MAKPITERAIAEQMIETGQAILLASKQLDRVLDQATLAMTAVNDINAVPHQEHIEDIAKGYIAAGNAICERLDAEGDRATERAFWRVGGYP
jgi:hypothetical protein